MTCTQESFLKDVANHQISVMRDEGAMRHIRFKQPGTSSFYFDLITWPGYLCLTGDMGTYVFSRLDDMFEFFRRDEGEDDGKLKINRGYWSEKLKAVDTSGACKGSAAEFSKERFTRVINKYRMRWMREGKQYDGLSKVKRRELWEAIDEEVLFYIEDGEHEVYRRANEFRWQADARHSVYRFDDLWDHRFEDYTYHFTWCCYALAWGIGIYDKHKEA